MSEQEKNIKDILEVVTFIKDNAASKEDLTEVKEDLTMVKATMATKSDLVEVKEDLNIVKVDMATKEDLNSLGQEIKADSNQLQNSVDAYAHRAETYFQEMAALRSKVNRLEDWITKIAKKVDVELTS